MISKRHNLINLKQHPCMNTYLVIIYEFTAMPYEKCSCTCTGCKPHTFRSWLLFRKSFADDLVNFLIVFQLIRSLPYGQPCGRIEEEHLLISCPHNTPASPWDQLAGDRFALVPIFIHSLILLLFLIIFLILCFRKI